VDINDWVKAIIYAVSAIIAYLVSEYVAGLLLHAIIADFDTLFAELWCWVLLKLFLIAIFTLVSFYGFYKLINSIFH